MKTYNDFKYATKSSIEGAISDSLSQEDILSVSLKIKASHAGKVNHSSQSALWATATE